MSRKLISQAARFTVLGAPTAWIISWVRDGKEGNKPEEDRLTYDKSTIEFEMQHPERHEVTPVYNEATLLGVIAERDAALEELKALKAATSYKQVESVTSADEDVDINLSYKTSDMEPVQLATQDEAEPATKPTGLPLPLDTTTIAWHCVGKGVMHGKRWKRDVFMRPGLELVELLTNLHGVWHVRPLMYSNEFC